MGFGGALMTHSDIADGTPVLGPGPATTSPSRRAPGMAVLSWRLMGGLSAAVSVDAGYKAFAVSAFAFLEAKRPH